MKPSPHLTLQKLNGLVNGQLLFAQLPPLGGDWEPVLGMTSTQPPSEYTQSSQFDSSESMLSGSPGGSAASNLGDDLAGGAVW